MGKIIPKNYKIGNMVYFVYDNFPHTGIIKYIHPEAFTVEDVTFLNTLDVASQELVVPKESCTKTGEIMLPKYPDQKIIDLIEGMDVTGYTYEAMPKRTIVSPGPLTPLIHFNHEMMFLLDDDMWYHYSEIYSKTYGTLPVLMNLDGTFVVPRWIAQPHFEFNNEFYEAEHFDKKVVNEYHIVSILQKDKEYNKILNSADKMRYQNDPQYTKELYDILKFHTDIIYRVDHDPLLGTEKNYKIPYKKIPGFIPETQISEKF